MPRRPSLSALPRRSRALHWTALILFIALGLSSASAQASWSGGRNGADSSLATFLTTNGRLDLPPSFRGTLDARNWELKSSENEPPRFVPRIEGDERWADSFYPNGLSDRAYALAANASGNIYVGGDFITVGTTRVNYVAKWSGSSWSALGYGFDGAVRALVVDGGGNLYAGGWFTQVCSDSICSASTGVVVNNIARWNGVSWVAVGNGMNKGVNALAVDSSNNVYAGGYFTDICGNAACDSGNVEVNKFAKWNVVGGGSWSRLGNGLNGVVYALAADSDNNIFIGGEFTNMCGDPTCGTVTARLNNITKWNPPQNNYWELSSGLNNSVEALSVDGSNNVYVGGNFESVCLSSDCSTLSTRVNRIAQWNPNGAGSWSPVGNGLNWGVSALAIDQVKNTLYVGGSFSNLCGDQACGTVASRVNGIAQVNLADFTSWSSLGNGMPGAGVMALNVSASSIFAAGKFAIAGEVGATRIAKYSAGAWSALGSGDGLNVINPYLMTGVSAITVDKQGDVYVGGKFNTAGRAIANNVARWNGTAWSALAYGVHGSVYAIAADTGGNIYVGGYFDYVCIDVMCTNPGPKMNNIARWNGSSWSSLEYGLDNGVVGLALDRAGNLYVGGGFSAGCGNLDCSSQGIQLNNIAKWNSGTWSPVGNGLNSGVNALAVDSSNNVFVGGYFDYACGDSTCGTPGIQLNRVAKWSPSGSGAWSPLGYGVKDDAYAMTVDNHNNVYAGGAFQFLCGNAECTSDGAQVNYIAKWDAAPAAAWTALNSGLESMVYGMAVGPGNSLFIGGSFIRACGETLCSGPGTPANRIARWNPTGSGNWSTLGSGTNGYVFALALQGGKLYVGGRFDQAGDKPSASFGMYTAGSSLFLPYVRR